MKGAKFRITRLLTVYALAILLLVLTSPEKLPPILFIVLFVLLFFVIYFTAIEIMRLLKRGSQNGDIGVRMRRTRMTAALGASFPVLVLLLQSIGQLTSWDMLTVTALFITAYFYIIKSSAESPNR